MSQVKHTPGPWDHRQRFNDRRHEIGVHGRTLATVWVREEARDDDGRPRFDTMPEGEANAYLIAAAPELLAVTQMVLDTASDTTPPELLAAATAAIAKAEGR